MMQLGELNKLIEQVGKDKGIEKEIIIDALERAMETAAKKKLGIQKEIEAQYNPELGEIELFQFMNVVEEVFDEDLDIVLTEAKNVDPDVEVGDSIGLKLDSNQFGRISAQTAKQVIIQRIRDAERELVLKEYENRVGDMITGIVRRFERGDVIVDLGRTLAIVLSKESTPNEHFKAGDRITAILLEVRDTNRGPQLILSRSHPDFLIKLFINEVPEVEEGVVQIKGCVREPGKRAKIAVYSTSSDVDPVGACVGMRGSRVQSVVQELRGEKIDIVVWDPDPATYVKNALAPAEIQKIIMDEDNNSLEVVVADDQLSLAIGKSGQNVRLAAKLTRWKIDILSESKVTAIREASTKSIMRIEGVNDTPALLFFQEGYRSYIQISEANPEDIMGILNISEEKATRIIENAKNVPDTPVEEEVESSKDAEVEFNAENLFSSEVEYEDEDIVKEIIPEDWEQESSLEKLRGIGKLVVKSLNDGGFKSAKDLFEADPKDINSKTGLGLEKCTQIKASAEKYKLSEAKK